MQRIGTKASRAVIALAAWILAFATFGASHAYAAEETQVYKGNDGWELAYSVSDAGDAVIQDVTAGGSGVLELPSSIDGHSVVEIAPEAFYNDGGGDLSSKLVGIRLPETLTTLGDSAFMGSGLTEISIPSSVEAIPARCFAGCAKLSKVVFEGEAMGYFGDQAFSGCSSLARIDIPELTRTVGNETYRIGKKCFYRCSNLETVVFHGDYNTFDPNANVHTGNVNSSITVGYYVANIDCFGNCDKLKSMVYYTQKDKVPSGTGSITFGSGNYADIATYQTLAFYASAEDSANCTNLLYSITCRDTCKILDILNGKVQQSDIWDEWGQRPELPEGMTWGVEGNAISYSGSVLSNTYNVIPVSENDLSYGWVSSAYIDEFVDSGAAQPTMMGAQSYPTYYLDDSGRVEGLDEIVAYLPSGKLADLGTYDIIYQVVSSVQLDRATIAQYSPVDYPKALGNYVVAAKAKSGGATQNQTSWTRIVSVAKFAPTVNAYGNADTAARLGRASLVASSSTKSKAVCGVVVPASDWRYQLLGAGLAGTGDGFLLFDNKDDYSSRAVTAFAESGVSAVQVVGSTSIVPESASPSAEVYLMDFLNGRKPQYKTRYSNDATIQELSDQVYTTIRRLQNAGNAVYGQGWGKTAIVASPDNCIDTLPIAQLAYSEKAPVFFTQSNGLLSDADMGYLKNDGFENIVIAGDSTYVSDACAAAIQAQCSASVNRVLNGGSDSLSAALGYLATAQGSSATVAIAATNEPANTVGAAIIAATKGGIMLPCSSSADAKRIQDYLAGIIAAKGQSSVSTVYLLGDFDNVDSNLPGRISKMWDSPLSTSIGVGDSFEIGDYVYALKSGNKAQCLFARNPSLAEAVVDDVSFEGAKYTAEAPAAGAFSKLEGLESIKIKSSSVKTIPASAFENLSISSMDLGSVTSVGDQAFSGCASLAKLSSSSLTAVGAKAFAGCIGLSAISLPKAKSVGAQAFEGCTSLKTLKLESASSLKAGAFKDCTALSSVNLPAAASLAVASVFEGCKSLGSFSAAKLKSVPSSAFSAFASLKSVSVPNAKTIGTSAFAGCKKLKSFSSKKATSIGVSAFSGCSKLAKVTLSATGLKKIGAKAFYGCKGLKKLTLKTKKLTAKKVGANAFKGMPNKAKVYVPKAKVASYKKAFVKKGLSKKSSVVAG